MKHPKTLIKFLEVYSFQKFLKDLAQNLTLGKILYYCRKNYFFYKSNS